MFLLFENKLLSNFLIYEKSFFLHAFKFCNIILGQGMHEPLLQRIVMNYNMGGLTKDEGHSYITRKLEGVGCHQKVFEDNAAEAVLNAANGIPRMINKICNRALMIGASRNLNIIDADIVMKAVDDIQLG